jgi:hypothetical protein
MRFVALAAGHAAFMHFALKERAVHVYLIQDLAIGVVQALIQQ